MYCFQLNDKILICLIVSVGYWCNFQLSSFILMHLIITIHVPGYYQFNYEKKLINEEENITTKCDNNVNSTKMSFGFW